MTHQGFLTPGQLVARWNGALTVGTLANWRSKGTGPTFAKLGGRVLYPVAQVTEWENTNMQSAG